MIEQYEPSAIEEKWYQFWEKHGLFKANEEAKDAYCIMIPPPNVTGTLHMGHAFQDTIMDALIRYQRMLGKNTLWQPGTDHAGIATQMVVERQLDAEGTSRTEVGRDEFTKRVWQWKEKSGGTIVQQLKRLGASPDWSRSRFTMDPGMSEAVIKVFNELYDEGLIYRGQRLVNWDPKLNTALSDLEVESTEEQGHMWHFRYPLANQEGEATSEYLTIATTRPETLFGDTAVAVNPEDPEHKQYIGRQVLLPLSDRLIPVIGDEHADPEKGTGCVKITPAHDFNDYAVGQRHSLPMINIMHKNATLNDNVPENYRGMDRFAARARVVEDMQQQGLLEKIEKHALKVPRGDRSGVVIEPLLTNQWYVDAKTLAQPAIKAVENGEVRFVPDNWKNTYFSWMRDIQDWCISRQLWWGHRIPAWYDAHDNIYVGTDEEAVRKKYNLDDTVALSQDPDVLDTWFSAGLWPFATLDWPEDNAALNTYYPTSVLVTGFDIIFFWVARMIMMGIKFMGEVPFKEVYIHGLVRDSYGQKMSKSKGNVLDPIDLIDGIELNDLIAKRTTGLMQTQPEIVNKIKKMTREEFPEGIKAYGCDALRFTFASLASTGRDINFDMGRIEGYRNFCNKIFNASRFVFMNTEGFMPQDNDSRKATFVEQWIISKLNHCIREYQKHMNSYRLDLASHAIYDFFWNTYCDWFVELSKPLLKSEAKHSIQNTLLNVLETALKLLHPFMPFITEEIWQTCARKLNREEISIAQTQLSSFNESQTNPLAEQQMEWLQKLIVNLRQIRSEMNISPAKPLSLIIENHTDSEYALINENMTLLSTIGKLERIDFAKSNAEVPPSATALVGKLKLNIPLAGSINLEEETNRINSQIKKLEQEITRCEGKLANKNFTSKAPAELVDAEKNKLAAYRNQHSELLQQAEKLMHI